MPVGETATRHAALPADTSASSQPDASIADRPEVSSLRWLDARSGTPHGSATAASLSTPARQPCRMNPHLQPRTNTMLMHARPGLRLASKSTPSPIRLPHLATATTSLLQAGCAL